MKRSVKQAKLLLFCVGVTFVGCGVKGPPVPYVSLEENNSAGANEIQKVPNKEVPDKQIAKPQKDSVNVPEKGKNKR